MLVFLLEFTRNWFFYCKIIKKMLYFVTMGRESGQI